MGSNFIKASYGIFILQLFELWSMCLLYFKSEKFKNKPFDKKYARFEATNS